MRGRPRNKPAGDAALTFSEISTRTGIPRSTVYGTYRRAEEKFVIAYLILAGRIRRAAEDDKLAAA